MLKRLRSERRYVALGVLGLAIIAADRPVGPGKVDVRRSVNGLALRISIDPNRAGARNEVRMTIRAHGRPVRHAKVTVNFTMPAMAMGVMRFPMPESSAGVYRYSGPVPMMAGEWRLAFRVKSAAGRAALTVRDRVE